MFGTKKIKIQKNGKMEILTAKVIKEPSKNLSKDEQLVLNEEIQKLVKNAWGKIDKKYVQLNIEKSFLLAEVRDKKKVLVGITFLKKVLIKNKTIYSIGLTAIDKKNQSSGLLRHIFRAIGKEAFWDSLKKGQSKIEFIFITPNIRVIQFVSKISTFVYPNLEKINLKTGKIPQADKETWEQVNAFLKKTGEKYTEFSREGCIMEGFYDKRPDLVQKKPKINNKLIKKFADNYLYKKIGREVVVRCEIDLLKAI